MIDATTEHDEKTLPGTGMRAAVDCDATEAPKGDALARLAELGAAIRAKIPAYKRRRRVSSPTPDLGLAGHAPAHSR